MDRPDLAWKLLASRYPEAFLHLFFADIGSAIDWSRPYCLPDHELAPRQDGSKASPRHPDVVLLAADHAGGELCLHIEIQCCRQAGFPSRMAAYHTSLRERFGLPVASLALLADPGVAWRPDRFDSLQAGSGLSVQFRIAKLMDWRDRMDELLSADNPAAFAAAIHLTALQTRHAPERRQVAKNGLSRLMHEKEWRIGELFTLQSVLDYMLPTALKWQRRITMDIEDLLALQPTLPKHSLNYLLAENIRKTLAKAEAKASEKATIEGRAAGLAAGHAEGLAEGRALGQAEGERRGLLRGKAQLLELQLSGRFGPLPASAAACLGRAGEAQLEALALTMLEADSLPEAFAMAGLDA